MNIAQYTKAASLEEAWELNQKRSAVVLGGCCWLRLSPQRRIAQAIDLSALGLDQIEARVTASVWILLIIAAASLVDTLTRSLHLVGIHQVLGWAVTV